MVQFEKTMIQVWYDSMMWTSQEFQAEDLVPFIGSVVCPTRLNVKLLDASAHEISNVFI